MARPWASRSRSVRSLPPRPWPGWVRRQRLAQLFTTGAFILQAAALGNYFAQVEPVNVRFRGLAPGQVPSDFLALRARWEYGHALDFGLFAAAFILLGCALLMRQAAERCRRAATTTRRVIQS